jgi:hypothetical protein
MILKHTGNVKAISRVGLPEFQSKDRLELEVLEVEAQADAGLTSLQPTRQSGAYAAALGFSLFSVNLRVTTKKKTIQRFSDFSLFFTPKAEALSFRVFYRRRLKSRLKSKSPNPIPIANRKSKESECLLGFLQMKLDRVLAGVLSKPTRRRNKARVLGLADSDLGWASGLGSGFGSGSCLVFYSAGAFFCPRVASGAIVVASFGL